VVVEHSGSAAGAMQLGAAAASPVGGLMPAVVVAPPIEIRVWGGGGFHSASRRGGRGQRGDWRWVVVRRDSGGAASAVGG
jgi:hypothetical protein